MQRGHVVGHDRVLKVGAALKERGAQLEAVRGDPQFAVAEPVRRPVGGIEAVGLLGRVVVPVGQLAPQGLQLRAVGRRIAGVAPGPEHQLAVGVDVQVDAGGVVRRGVRVERPALVGELGQQIVLHRLRLRLRGRAGPAIQ